MNEYEKLLALLAENKIEFVTVGGFACAFNGFTRATEDVDILLRKTDPNIQNFIRVLSSYESGFARELTVDDFVDEEGAIRIIEKFPLDVFVRMSGLTYENVHNDIRWARLGEAKVPYLSRERLIFLKEKSTREIDKLDVIQLKKLGDVTDR
jgi:hypothetical protein